MIETLPYYPGNRVAGEKLSGNTYLLTVARSDKETADYRPSSSVAGRIKQMAWSDAYREKLLFNSEFASEEIA
jgi:hypothetical protein